MVDSSYGINGMLSFLLYNPESDTEETTCKSWFETFTYIQALKIGAVASVVVTNVLLKQILKHLMKIEKPSDQTTLTSSLTLKIFLASFVNTALLTLLINGNIDYLYGEDGEGWSGMGLLGGSHKDLGVDWYKEIGVPIIVTMLVNSVTPHVASFVGWLILRIKQMRDRGCGCSFNGKTRQVTQEALENLFTGPQFVMYLRLSQLLNSIFVCIMFSSGMPIMIPILFFTVFSYLIVDKILLLRFYSLPPLLDAKLQQVSGSGSGFEVEKE